MSKMMGAGIILLSLSACLKDSPRTTNFNIVQPVIEQLPAPNLLFSGATSGANTYCYYKELRVDSSYSWTDSLPIDVGGPLIGSNVVVTFGIDTANFNAFNNNNGGGFTVLPSADYTYVNGNTVTIPANTGTAACYIKFNTKTIDWTKSYILPIAITNASGQTISGNYGTIMYYIVPGNQYMGLYLSQGYRTFEKNTYTINDLKPLQDLSAIWVVQGGYPTAGNQPGAGPQAFDPSQVVTNCADVAIYQGIGEQMDLTVNPDNSVTVSNDNLYGFGKQTYALNPGTSNYNPTTHTFTLSYGFIDPYSGDTNVVSEVMTRLK